MFSHNDNCFLSVKHSVRNRNCGTCVNNLYKEKKKKMLYHRFSRLFLDASDSPLILMQLSQKDTKRHKKNSIHVSGCYSKDGRRARENKWFYSSIVFGENIRISKKKYGDSKILNVKELNILEVNGNYVMITTTIDDARKCNRNVIIIDTSCRPSFKATGVLVLLVAIVDRTKRNGIFWNKSIHQQLMQCKPNIITKGGSNHFDSRGYIYSFGNKGSYGMINNSSVDMYATRKFKDKLKMEQTIESANDINNKCATAITEGISCLKKIIPNISNLISPIIQVAYNMQNKIGSVNLKKITTSENGIWQSEICVNAKTNQFHTEKDVTYTFITIPQQKFICKTGILRNNTFFYFK